MTFVKKLPTFFTISNLLFGILAIILAISEDLREYSVLLIILSMLLDGVDGRIARRFNAQSDFGKELDSLSDVISFGLAPAIIVYMTIADELNIALNAPFLAVCLIVAVFPICGVLRLARFNILTTPSLPYFDGLPITAAGTILACLSSLLQSQYILLPSLLVLSYLMISHVKYPSFKKKIVPKTVYLSAILFLLFFLYRKFTTDPLHAVVVVVTLPLVFYVLYGFKMTFDYRRNIDEDEHGVEIKK